MKALKTETNQSGGGRMCCGLWGGFGAGGDGRTGNLNLNSWNDNEPINNDTLRHNTIMNFGEFPFPLETCLISASSYFGFEKP